MRPNGDVAVRERVNALLLSNQACWCPMVRLELWNGANGDQAKKLIRELEHQLPLLPITDKTWDGACALVQKARIAGITVPATDALIAACALQHGAGIESADADFDRLKTVST